MHLFVVMIVPYAGAPGHVTREICFGPADDDDIHANVRWIREMYVLARAHHALSTEFFDRDTGRPIGRRVDNENEAA